MMTANTLSLISSKINDPDVVVQDGCPFFGVNWIWEYLMFDHNSRKHFTILSDDLFVRGLIFIVTCLSCEIFLSKIIQQSICWKIQCFCSHSRITSHWKALESWDPWKYWFKKFLITILIFRSTYKTDLAMPFKSSEL